MTRARRCRDSHQRQAFGDVGPIRDPVVHLFPTDQWVHVVEMLDGLLDVEFPGPFTNIELLCPTTAWLVVDLSSVRARSTAAPSLRYQINQVLQALTWVLTQAETLRTRNEWYELFWKRVLTSDMVPPHVQTDELAIRGFTRYMKVNGSHVAFQWRGRPLETTQVIQPLQNCLRSVIDRPSAQFVPIKIAFRFEDCHLTPKRLGALCSLLQTPADANSMTYLFAAHTLQELSLSGNILHAHMLLQLSPRLRDPSTRRIDGLKLNDAMPTEPCDPSVYATAVARVCRAVLSRPSPSFSVDVDDDGVLLSLENCIIRHVVHVDMLADVLTHATRPLRALSLACWQLLDETALDRFALLLFTQLPTATHDFDLNVSCVQGQATPVDDVEHALLAAHSARMEEKMPLIQSACAAGQRVSCRLWHYGFAARDRHMNDQLNVELSSVSYYPVRHITDDGIFQITIPDLVDATGWVNWWSIADVSIDNAFVIPGMSSGLIVDRCRREHLAHESKCVVRALAVSCGARLRRLSMRQNAWSAPSYVAWCPELEEVNAEGFGQCYEVETGDSEFVGAHLQVVNMAKCKLNVKMFRKLLTLPVLKSLRVASNPLAARAPSFGVADDLQGLDVLYDHLVSQPRLEYVDMRDTGFDALNERHNAAQQRIEKLLASERTSAASCTAFAVVVRQLETKFECQQRLCMDVVKAICAFADQLPRRCVEW